jgi:hypothetical protein
VDTIGPWEGRIFADLAGDLQVRWSATAPEGWVDGTYVNLTLEPPDATPNTMRARRNWTSRDNEHVRATGEIMNADLGGPDALCDRVIVHFTNLPRISPAEYLVDCALPSQRKTPLLHFYASISIASVLVVIQMAQAAMRTSYSKFIKEG